MDKSLIKVDSVNLNFKTEFKKQEVAINLSVYRENMFIEFVFRVQENVLITFRLSKDKDGNVDVDNTIFDNDWNLLSDLEIDATTNKEAIELLNWFKDNYKTLI